MNEAAFPNPHRTDELGMTLRDYFAAKAMQSLILLDYVHDNSDSIADKAYTMANAMLKTREA
jgi:hypothetical protein